MLSGSALCPLHYRASVWGVSGSICQCVPVGYFSTLRCYYFLLADPFQPGERLRRFDSWSRQQRPEGSFEGRAKWRDLCATNEGSCLCFCDIMPRQRHNPFARLLWNELERYTVLFCIGHHEYPGSDSLYGW